MPFQAKRTCLILAVIAICLHAAAAGAAAQEAAALWQQINLAPFDSEKTTNVENVTLVRDRIRITFLSGTLQFSKPALDLVYAASFRGKGRVEVKPPNALESQQLRLFTGQDNLAMDFTEGAFTFSDGTFEEIGRGAKWQPSPDKEFGELYLRRQEARESVLSIFVPRLFKSLLSEDRKRTALFVADLKTGDKGWVLFGTDALSLEEATIGRIVNAGEGYGFDTWLSFPTGDRTPAQAYSDPLAREDFNIKKYQIEATVTAGAELSAVTRVTLTAKSPGERVWIFELDSNLRVQSVKNQQGAELAFLQPQDPKGRSQSYGDFIAVVLPAPLKPGESQTIEFTYSGKRVVVGVGQGSFFCQSHGWYPAIAESFAARSDFELTFKTPKKFTLVATGSKVSESTQGDWTTTSWKSNIPLAVAGFAFGQFKVYTEKTGNIAIEAYANPEPDDTMKMIRMALQNAPVGTLSPSEMIKPMGQELGNMVRLFETYFGPYPYERLAVSNIPYSYGQGWPTLIYLSVLSFLDSTQRNVLGIRGDENVQLTDFFRAHECSHQWWGHKVGWKSYHDQWLSEGFAQFSGNLYTQYRVSEKEYLNRLKKDKEDLLQRDVKNRVYESLGPIWMGARLSTSDAPGAYSNVVYNKGGLVVNAIRRMLWNPQSKTSDERFIAMMKDYCETYFNKPASTEDFKAVLEKHMIPVMDLEGNKRMDWFFRQYVYGTGIPEYRLEWSTQDAGGGQWSLSGKVTQSGVSDGWLDVLPVYAQVAGKVFRLGMLSVRAKEATFSFNVPWKVEKLILNNMEDTIAIIK